VPDPMLRAVPPMTCDVVIPVHNQPRWVARCVAELLGNTPADSLGRVLLVDDASCEDTRAQLERIVAAHDALQLVRQDRRAGFPGTVNRGLCETSAPFVLLLNSDCLLTHDTVPKLMAQFRKDEQVGLVSPFSNHSEPLTVPLTRGQGHQAMNSLLEERFAGESMEACTVVGNALMISRECLEKTGELDESYGMGYYEETDYQFRAMYAGFTARAALDTYVFHYGGASFGSEAQGLERTNRRNFFRTWGDEYRWLAQQAPPWGPRDVVQQGLKCDMAPLQRGS
jgi:GT2 family glycosyltransferase